jgi:hypothetical protein
VKIWSLKQRVCLDLRTGPDLKEAIDRQVERLVKEGRLHLDENGLRLAENASQA